MKTQMFSFLHNCIAHPLLFWTGEARWVCSFHEWTGKKAWPKGSNQGFAA